MILLVGLILSGLIRSIMSLRDELVEICKTSDAVNRQLGCIWDNLSHLLKTYAAYGHTELTYTIQWDQASDEFKRQLALKLAQKLSEDDFVIKFAQRPYGTEPYVIYISW